MDDKKYEELSKHREEFTEAFKDVDEAKLNEALNNAPANQLPKDEDNPARRLFDWKDCPLKMTAGYYANNKVLGEEMPIPEINELKALLDGKKETTEKT